MGTKLNMDLSLSVNSFPIRILFLVLIFIFPLPVLITHSRLPVIGGSQWSGGFYLKLAKILALLRPSGNFFQLPG